MGYSKQQFVHAALEELGLAAYVFDVQPEQLESAMRRLDSMMAEWNGRGIRLGYPIPGSPEFSSLDEPSNVPDSANEAIITNLAIKLAPSYGKQVSAQTMSAAAVAFQTIMQRSIEDVEMKLPGNMPTGAGNKRQYGYVYGYTTTQDPVNAGGDGPINF